MPEEKGTAVHNVIIEQSKRLNMSGVREVKTFDDETIILDTVSGTLTIKGEELTIGSFSVETGELSAEGRIRALVYTDSDRDKGMLRRLLK